MKHWSRQESKERFPKAISPLGWSLLHVPLEASLNRMSETLGVKKYARNEMVIWDNFYIYTRKNFFTNLKNLKFNYPHLLKIISQVVVVFFEVLAKSWGAKISFKKRFVTRLFHKLLGPQIQSLIERWPAQIEHLKSIMGRDFHLDQVEVINYEKFVGIRKQMQADSREFFAEDFNVYFLKMVLFELLKMDYSEAALAQLTNHLKGNFSVNMIEDFNNQNISPAELKKRYGHLTDNWDLYSPTLGEIDSVWANRTYSAKAEVDTTPTAPVENELVIWFQKLVLMDEDLRAYSSLQYPQARRLMAMVEATTAWKELIIKDNSVYFLHLNEIEFGLKKSDFHLYFDLIKERKNGFLKALSTNPPFELVESITGTMTDVTNTSNVKKELGNITLKGTPVSRGTLLGVVTHINDYSDLSKISKKSILVLESATPVYAPFYALSGGIISEMGGQLSHGAIVAREYGIPMLSGVENVCSTLVEGQSIFLDANNGTIKVND